MRKRTIDQMLASQDELEQALIQAEASGRILGSTGRNIRAILTGTPSKIYPRVIAELLSGQEFAELNDRFFRTLAFGTGGLRGRTIGKVVTKTERGTAKAGEPPEF